MSVPCRACHRVNPTDAAFCYFDGVPLEGQTAQQAAPPGTQPFPMPFTFASGRSCRNFTELAHACHTSKADALEVLREGHFERFLGGLGRLDLARAAREAARFPDLERGLDQLLGQLPGDVVTPGRLLLKAPAVNLGTLAVGTDRRFQVTLENGGMRLLYGSVMVEDTPWLSLGDSPGAAEKLFQFDGRTEVTVHVVGQALRAGKRPLEGRLIVSSNGGTATVLVQAEVPVKPFPEGVLKGATTPRQVAEKAKAAPKEAAAFFEKQAVPQWYRDNGWVYPVQGPPASGIGAIQQFFEALGLVKPPKVTLSESALQLHGRPSEAVSHTLRAETEENRPVFAHATSDRPWLTVGAPQVELKGRVALIPLAVRSIPANPGETLTARLTVQANGNQRFVVPVTLAVSGTRTASRSRPADEEFIPEVVAVSETVVPTPSAPVDVLPLADALVEPAAPPPRDRPARRRTQAEPVEPAPRSAGIGWLVHLIPLGVFALVFLTLVVRDLLVPAEEALPPVDIEPPPVVEIDPNPQIAIRFHDGPKGDEGDKLLPRPTMRFGILMAGGGAAEPKKLTFDLWGRTNNTCLRVDGKDILFGDEVAGRWEDRAAQHWRDEGGQEHEGMKSVWSLRQIAVRVTQTVEVVPGEVTEGFKGNLIRHLDTCLIRYRLENLDSSPHAAGLRFMLDTFIGANDGVPFVIPGESGLCDTVLDFAAPRGVPGYIHAVEFDDRDNPGNRGAVVRIQFKLGDPIETPDRVTLGAWPNSGLALLLGDKAKGARAQDTLWDVPVLPIRALADEARRRRRFRDKPDPDSAVVMYWEPRRLAAHASREVGFAYGLGQVAAPKENGGNFLLTGDVGAVEGHDFTIQAVVSRPRPGQTLTLKVPNGLALAAGTEAAQRVPPVAAGAARESSTVTWQVRALREGVYRLEVSSDAGGAQKYPVRIRPVLSPFGRN